MNKLKSIIEKFNLRSLIMASFLGAMLLVTSACNSGNELGARPENPPVQLGGQNNPHKAGGDGMAQYRATDDPRVTNVDPQASLPFSNLIAAANKSETTYPTNDKNMDGLLYSDTNDEESLNSVEDLISPQSKKLLLDPTQIPAKQQPIIDRSNPDNKLLEKTGQMFDDSGVLD